MSAKYVLTLLITLCLASTGYSATLSHHIQGVGPQDRQIRPYICLQDGNGQVVASLSYGQSIDANKAVGNPYYVGATLRFGGCESQHSYLGYLGINLNEQHTNSIAKYTPPEGVHIAYQNASIDAQGALHGEIQYTPIDPNFQWLRTPPAKPVNWMFTGVNLSGLEFGKVINPFVVPNLSVADATTKQSDLAEMTAFMQAGMNTVRVPVSWGYLQLDDAGKGELNQAYYDSFVKPLLETLTTAKIYTIIDLHAYMRYSPFGKAYSGCGPEGPCPDGILVLDESAYMDVWTQLLALIKSDKQINPHYLLLDLINEPTGVPNDAVFTIQAAVIKALRTEGFDGYILVEGNNWSGLHSWTDTWASTDGKTRYSNALLFSRAHFNKAGITDLSKIVINVHQYLDQDYSGTHDTCLTDLTTTGANGFNLQAFATYLQENQLQAMVTEFGAGRDEKTCGVALAGFMNYLKAHAAKGNEPGFLGWTIWSVGHGWGDYNLRVRPDSYQMRALKPFLY